MEGGGTDFPRPFFMLPDALLVRHMHYFHMGRNNRLTHARGDYYVFRETGDN